MKIAIHHRPGSFSDRWIEYCKQNEIDYKIVNAYDNNIVEQVSDCDAFMWHHHHANVKDTLFANQLIYSLETAGIKCFPDFHTTWHFDDKVGQKYLLEAVDETHGLMDHESAVARLKEWCDRISPYVSNDTKTEMSIQDTPAWFSNHREYNLMEDNEDNFFTVKANTIKALE